jgi:hypothetical protein
VTVPTPRYVIIGGTAVKSEGDFYLDWRENGKRKTEKIGTDPKEAKEAWTLRSGIRSGEIEDPDPPISTTERDKGLTIGKAIENYLVEAQATSAIVKMQARYTDKRIAPSSGGDRR